ARRGGRSLAPRARRSSRPRPGAGSARAPARDRARRPARDRGRDRPGSSSPHGSPRRACTGRGGAAVGADGRLADVMSEIEIGRNKRGRRSYSLDDVAVVPSRRTRDPEDVSTAWQVDAYHFDIPIFAAPMDSLMSPGTAIALGRLGGLGVLDLEGLWTRYEDPTAQFARIAEASDEDVVDLMRELY